MLKALVVDDEYLVRMGITQTIDWAEYNVEIVGEASNGEEGLELALLHRPDVIITDIRMPFMNGLEFIEKIRVTDPLVGIVVLSGYDEFQYAQAAIRYGASTYLLKPINIEELAATVRNIGNEILEKKKHHQHYAQLRGEISSISKQFWQDLLHGQLQGANIIAEKTNLLDLQLEPGDVVIPLAIALSPSNLPPEVPIWIALLEAAVTELLEGHSFDLLSLFHDSNLQSVIVVRTRETEEAITATRKLGKQLCEWSMQSLGQSLSVGIGKPANNWHDLEGSYRQAVLAAQRASSSFERVLYADEDAGARCRREIREALAFIREHYAENITVDMVATAVFVSPTHLMHLFRKDLNKTFYECLTEYRIEEAKRMLRNPMYRVYEVGNQVGFTDSKYFSQIFKKMTGIPPSEYAKTYG
ncbi:two-component system response regulator YesN [Paenibacillus anaericanus]|uniref:response regulator n=1 Tax=Paenibacillus anaericanus TaxID=170367 RepID=UPI00277E217D|nr:response regulator [Paenibacillus anaericanus]MDQ0091321.1 two-component system response regulator YesN [Paenibacillus anaericanus]